jgi:hypothetical protein
VLAGGLAAGLLATLIPLASNPDVLGQYWEAMTHRTPEQWKSPTIGSVLRELFGEEQFRLQFVPTILGLAWLAAQGWQQRDREWRWGDQMPLLLLVSFATASYGAWPFDLVVLLPAVVQVGASAAASGDPRRISVAVLVYLALNAAALAMNLAHVTSDRFVWVAPSLLVAYVFLRPGRAA